MLAITVLVALSSLAFSAPSPLLSHDSESVAPTSIAMSGRQLPGDCTYGSCYRTMQDIAWGCLATIFACTWVAHHPDIPTTPMSGWARFKYTVLDILLIVLIPEVVIMLALGQRIRAGRIMDDYNKKFYPDEPSPTIWQRLSGWFCSIWQRLKEWFQVPEVPGGNNPGSPWTVTHGFFIQMGGLTKRSGGAVGSVHSIPERLDISEKEINDKSKGDLFTKSLAVAQTMWFIFQCITRWVTQLPVTELEVVTLAFAFLSIGTWILWWDKPQNLRVPISMCQCNKLQEFEEEANATQKNLEVEGVPDTSEKASSLISGSPGNSLYDRTDLKSVGSTTLLTLDDGKTSEIAASCFAMLDSWKCALPICLISAAFGAVHLLPLRLSEFPSSAEKGLWALSAAWVTFQPALLFSLGLWGGWTVADWKANRHWALEFIRRQHVFVAVIGAVAYMFARVFLIVVAFTTLRALPPDAHRNIVWTSFLPHL